MSGNKEHNKNTVKAGGENKAAKTSAANSVKGNNGNTLIKDTVIITLITLVAGLVLGFVYELTKEPIRIQKEQKQAAACAEVFKEADSNGVLQNVLPLTFEQTDVDVKANEAVLENTDIAAMVDEVYLACKNDGTVYGYVISVTTKEGYGGDIRFYMGVTTDGVLKGISILEISETPGLGMRAPEVLVPQFRNVSGSDFVVTKNGKTKENEIDAITSATITSKAVTRGVNYGMKYFEEITKGGTQ